MAMQLSNIARDVQEDWQRGRLYIPDELLEACGAGPLDPARAEPLPRTAAEGVARAVGIGVFKEHLPFLRTSKGGNSRKGADFPAFWEAVIAALLLIGAALVVITNYKQVYEINIFALVLVVQSMPFLAASAIATLECSRFNEFGYW